MKTPSSPELPPCPAARTPPRTTRVLAFFAACLLGAASTLPVRAAPDPSTTIGTDSAPVAPATDPGYRLSEGDRLSVLVFGEPDLGAQQMIDRRGIVRLPLIGDVAIAGRTVREAEALIEETYRGQEMLKDPQVTLSMVAYAPREVVVLGAVRTPGTFQFPADATELDIRDVIARQGGFTPVAKGGDVAVTRRLPEGGESTVVVDVERMMSARARRNDRDSIFHVHPGDRIFVPERLF